MKVWEASQQFFTAVDEVGPASDKELGEIGENFAKRGVPWKEPTVSTSMCRSNVGDLVEKVVEGALKKRKIPPSLSTNVCLSFSPSFSSHTHTYTQMHTHAHTHN